MSSTIKELCEAVGPCCLAVVFMFTVAHVASAQRVIISEDFESNPPDTLPDGADFYARSVVGFVDPNTEPAKIVVSGGAFADPFDAENQSLVFHNPNSAAQMAITWTSAFQDDPSTFRNGTIEFDVWMDKPLPNPGKFWSFLDIRTGYGGADRSAVTTSGDVTVWDNIRIQNLFGQPEPVESVVDAGAQFSLGLQTTYTDPVPDGLMGPDQSFHVRFEINGTPGSESYVLKLNDTPITWLQDGEMVHPWVPGAPGINMLSFLTDASAFFSGGASNVYLDNLIVVNNDLPPLEELAGDYNGDEIVNAADYTVWRDTLGQMGSGLAADGNGNDEVDAGDYDVWEQHFGETAGSGSGIGGEQVPEPASLAIAVFMMGLLFAQRFQR